MLPFYLGFLASLFAILSAVLLFAILLYLLSTERQAPHIRKSETKGREQSQDTLVSIIIAARNEEEKIARCISSLIAQSYQNIEILVVDDNSTDKTSSIAAEFEGKDPRVHTISPGAKPQRWVGKSWPCERGFQVSKGELLLFVDADSVFEPKAVEYSVKCLHYGSIDMLSISPRVNLTGIWAKATLPLVSAGINLLYPMKKVNDPKSRRAYVFGTFILVKKSVYAAIGGHEAIRERIVEDAAIAQLAKSKGYKLRVMIGDGLVTTDWEHEFSSIYRGMERVFSDSIRSYGLVSLLDAVLVFFLGLYPIVFIVGYASYSIFVRNFMVGSNLVSLPLNAGFVASLMCVLFSLSMQAKELHITKAKKIGLTPFLYPIGFCLFISAIVTSTLKVSGSKSIEWKGQKFEQKPVARV